MRDYDRKIGIAGRDWEISGAGGWITSVDGKSTPPPESASPMVTAKADNDRRNVLIGYALLFNQIIQHPTTGQYLMVRPTAFKFLMLGETKFFQHQHDENLRVGSTKDRLTLHADEKGIAFRLQIPSTALGKKTRDLVRSNEKQAMSALFTATKIEKHTVDGVEVGLVLEAELHEISLCEFGANSDAFAVLVHDSAEWVTDMSKSGRMNDEMDRAHIQRAIRRLEELSKSNARLQG